MWVNLIIMGMGVAIFSTLVINQRFERMEQEGVLWLIPAGHALTTLTLPSGKLVRQPEDEWQWQGDPPLSASEAQRLAKAWENAHVVAVDTLDTIPPDSRTIEILLDGADKPLLLRAMPAEDKVYIFNESFMERFTLATAPSALFPSETH